MISLKQILLEFNKLDEKLPPDLRQKVGNVFFGSDPNMQKIQKAKPEDDTKWEDDLYRKLVYWINSPNTVLASYFKQNKDLISKLAKEFPALLMPPIGDLAYRGTRIKIDSLERAFRTKKFEVAKIAGREVFYFKKLAYNPNRDSQSWSVNPKVAFKFTGHTAKEDNIAVVYVTKVNKDFIFNPVLLNTLWKNQGGGGKEDETIRIAKEGTFEAFVDTSVLHNSWDLRFTENFIHRVPSAKPYFDTLLNNYNKDVNQTNKESETDDYQNISSIEELIDIYRVALDQGINYDYEFPPPGSVWGYSEMSKQYQKYAKKYINTLKL